MTAEQIIKDPEYWRITEAVERVICRHSILFEADKLKRKHLPDFITTRLMESVEREEKAKLGVRLHDLRFEHDDEYRDRIIQQIKDAEGDL